MRQRQGLHPARRQFRRQPVRPLRHAGQRLEWTEDCATPTHAGAPIDGSAVEIKGCDERIVKGGAFHSVPWLLRAATRGGGLPASFHAVAAGIRLARNLD